MFIGVSIVVYVGVIIALLSRLLVSFSRPNHHTHPLSHLFELLKTVRSRTRPALERRQVLVIQHGAVRQHRRHALGQKLRQQQQAGTRDRQGHEKGKDTR